MLRVVVGLLLVAHGIPKLFDIGSFVGYVASITGEPLNWPVAIGTIMVEFLGGILLVVGFQLRPVALLVGLWFLGISVVVHFSDFLLIFNLIGDSQTSFEYPFLIAISSLALAFWNNNKTG